MTPLEIGILTWYHHRTGDYGRGHGDMNFEMPVVQEALERFVTAGLLVKDDTLARQKFRGVKEALDVYVEALGRVPLPMRTWVLPTYREWISVEDERAREN